MVSFTDKGWSQYSDWEEEDKKTHKKIKKLMKSISRDGAMQGEGKPEKLKNEVDKYSRRIDEKNRLIYIASGRDYTITSCKGHYEEK